MNVLAANTAWLPYLPGEAPTGDSPAEVACAELAAGFAALGIEKAARVEAQGSGDAFHICEVDDTIHVTGGETGVLYGAYRLLSRLYLGEPATADESPFYPLRILNHWDNMDGTVERGYAGRSLFFRDGRVSFDAGRIRRFARLLSSVGINAVCPNNVNVAPPADRLITGELLHDAARLADILRPFGIRLLLSVEFSLPTAMGLPTADPVDAQVQEFWKTRADEVYQHIPDLVGFLVKADSENRPGPFTYDRTHAHGANMLARALAPHGGKLFWRCFVYNCAQDWRDQITDRPKAAYDHYAPLDGQFDENVVLQVKNGPLDFQVREPLSPLLLTMSGTNKALEVQLAQEYTGHQVDLFYQAPQWREILDVLPRKNVCCVVGVSNLGDDENWTGHDLAQANLYAFGKMCWDGKAEPDTTAFEWARLTFPHASREVADLLLRSPDTYEKYVSPLGLGFMVNPHNHYGPNPMGYEFSRWGTFHRADREAVGVDRSSRGTGFSLQYPQPLRSLYDDPATCLDRLLLFFHRLRYDFVMRDGRTLLQRVYDDHFEGAREAEELEAAWLALKGRIAPDIFDRVCARFAWQVCNAREWRDVINTFFCRLSGVPDVHGRMIHP